jgi:hypothetical protein
VTALHEVYSFKRFSCIILILDAACKDVRRSVCVPETSAKGQDVPEHTSVADAKDRRRQAPGGDGCVGVSCCLLTILVVDAHQDLFDRKALHKLKWIESIDVSIDLISN